MSGSPDNLHCLNFDLTSPRCSPKVAALSQVDDLSRGTFEGNHLRAITCSSPQVGPCCPGSRSFSLNSVAPTLLAEVSLVPRLVLLLDACRIASTVRALLAAFVITVLASTSFAQQPKVLAPHRPIPPLIPQSQQQPLPPAKPGSLAGGFWMTDPNTHSTLYLKNVVDIAPVTVNPILFLSNGNKYPLPAVTLDPSGTAVIDINAALQNLGIASYSTLSGYVELDYNWPWVPLCATIRVVDLIHSTIFTYGIPPSPSNQTPTNNQPTSLLGMWWKYDNNVTGFVSLANTSSQTIAAAVAVTDAQGIVLGTHNVNVSPNGTKIVSLPELQQTSATEGGLQVAYTGPPGALDVNGGIEDQSIGYSANLRFAPAASGTSASSSVAAVGVMAGAADPMMLFPAGTTFTPYAVVRNVSNTAISVSPTLWWMQGGTASSYVVGTLTIAPGQVQRLNLTSGLSSAGLSTFSGSITLEMDMQGPQGSLLVQVGSVDQTGTYVFEVMPHVVQESVSKSIGYWSTANGDDTMVSIWNPADEAQDFVFRLVFSGGSYLLPVHLGVRATQSFNISQLIQNQVPDTLGNVIPASIHEGSAVLGGAQADVQHILVALDSGTYNVRKATCGVNCVYCDGYTSFAMDPGSASFAVQATKQYQFIGTYSNGSQYNVAGPWSSSNTSVATVASSTGVATGVAVGTANFITSFDEPVFQGNVCSGNNASCSAFASGTPSGGGNVTPSVSFSSTQVQVGQTATISATVTPSANTVPISLSISSPAAIVSPTGTFTQNTSIVVQGLSVGTATLSATVSNSDGTTPVGSTSFQVVPPPPTIQSISPGQGLVGTAINVTINGSGFLSGSTVSAGSNVSVTNVSVTSSTQITATFTPIDSSSAGGNQTITVTAGGQTSPSSTFYVQLPSKVSISNYESLVLITNGSVLDYFGNVLRTNRCGGYRNIAYSLLDQKGGTSVFR